MIPAPGIYTIKKGDRGIPAWAVQRALNSVWVQPQVVEDGVYGKLTKIAVAGFQGTFDGMVKDGVFGPKTSAVMSGALQHLAPVGLPMGLLRGVIAGESGDLIAAVNDRVAGGKDCGYTQRRIYAPDYNDRVVVRRAFDSAYQIKLLAQTTKSRHDTFYGKPGAKTHERAWRLAVLMHNYPYAATELAEGDWPTSYALSPQPWVEAHHLHFPDGHPVRTPMDWCARYSLGDPDHDEPGQMVRSVDW